jgi:hypothetical protein
MKCHALQLFVASAIAILATTASAQDFDTNKTDEIPFDPQVAPGSMSLTPDMWFYLHEQRREEDPQMVVRRNAEQKAAARRNRIAAMRWFGYSASRPTASPSPFTGRYSPTWVGNGMHPYKWVGTSGITATLPIDATRVRR